MIYEIVTTPKYDKDYKKAKKEGLDVDKLNSVLLMLSQGQVLPKSYRNHKLRGGQYAGDMECHIADDWLLIYLKEKKSLTLYAIRTGTHKELFGD